MISSGVYGIISDVALVSCTSAGGSLEVLTTALSTTTAATWTPIRTRRSLIHAFSTNTVDLFSDESRVVVHRLIERFVRLFVPPREERIVAVVERVPVAQVAAQAVDRDCGSISNSLLDVATTLGAHAELDRAAPVVHLLAQVVESRRDFRGIDRFHATSRFFECDDFVGKRNERLDLAELARLDVELSEQILKMVLEQQVLDLSVLAHRVEVLTLQRREPFVVELPEAFAPCRRYCHRIRTRETAAIDGVALDRAAHLAGALFSSVRIDVGLGGDLNRKKAE